MAPKQTVGELHGVITQDAPQHQELAPVDERHGETPITALIRAAINKLDADNGPAIVETLRGLYDLHERDMTKRAEASFNRAMAVFQAQCPAIKKASTAKIQTRSGSSFVYKYAELDEIAETIRPHMVDAGLSYSWDAEITGELIRVICTLRHQDGHSVQSGFQCPTDTKAEMSGAQRHGAAVTYAKRQSLVAVLGLTTTEADTDAQRHIDRVPEKITGKQAAHVAALIEKTGTDIGKFLAYFEVGTEADLTTEQYQKAVAMLGRKETA